LLALTGHCFSRSSCLNQGCHRGNTPWDPVPVRRRLARRMQQVIDPSSWVFDDTGFVKDGR
jgi:DDE superfamily endonuclease